MKTSQLALAAAAPLPLTVAAPAAPVSVSGCRCALRPQDRSAKLPDVRTMGLVGCRRGPFSSERGAAARLSRSRMAAAMPSPGIGATAMRGCGAGVGLVQQVEQARRGFDRVAALAQGDVAGDRAEADQIFVVRAPRSRRAAAAWPAHNGWRAGRALRSPRLASFDRFGSRSGRAAAVAAARRSRRRWSIRSRAGSRPPSMTSGIRPPRLSEHMAGPGRADQAAGVGRRRGERPAARLEQRLHRRMGGNAQRDRRQAGGDDAGDAAPRGAAARPASAAPANARRPARAPRR